MITIYQKNYICYIEDVIDYLVGCLDMKKSTETYFSDSLIYPITIGELAKIIKGYKMGNKIPSNIFETQLLKTYKWYEQQ